MLSQRIRAERWRLAGLSFRSFVQAMMPEYIVAPHNELMMSEIEKHAMQKNGRLNISVPPRHGKSQLASVFLPAWYLGKHPDREIIHVSHSAQLSNEFSRQVRSIIRDSVVYRSIFPAVALSKERTRVNDWRLMAGGGFRSLGVGGGVTGHGADLLIIDDPHKEGDADSLAALDSVFIWYATAARTRLSPGASIIFLMTRWHPLDLAGRILDLSEGDKWHKIVLPALAGENDPLGRAPGEALWPERFDADALHRVRSLDDRYFQALYQNNPQGSDDVQIRLTDFKKEGLLDDAAADDLFWTFDLASSLKETADYTVMARWAWCEGTLYLQDVRRLRAAFPTVRAMIIDLYNRYWRHKFVFPEDMLELLMMQQVAEDVVDAFRLYPVKMRGDKLQKASAFTAMVRKGLVSLNYDNRSVREWADEVVQFPLARFDDCVDSASVAAHYLGTRPIVDIGRILGGAND